MKQNNMITIVLLIILVGLVGVGGYMMYRSEGLGTTAFNYKKLSKSSLNKCFSSCVGRCQNKMPIKLTGKKYIDDILIVNRDLACKMSCAPMRKCAGWVDTLANGKKRYYYADKSDCHTNYNPTADIGQNRCKYHSGKGWTHDPRGTLISPYDKAVVGGAIDNVVYSAKKLLYK